MTYRAKSPGAAVRGASGWRGYRMQIEGPNGDSTNWQIKTPFDDFRPPEGTPGGRFLTWRELQVPGGAKAAPAQIALRPIDVETGRPLLAPGAEGEGGHTIAVNRQ